MSNPIEVAPHTTPEAVQPHEQREASKRAYGNAFFIDDTPLLNFSGIREVMELQSTTDTIIGSEMQDQLNYQPTRAEARSAASQERAAESPFVDLCGLIRDRIVSDEYYSQIGARAATSELLGPHLSFMRSPHKESFLGAVGTLIQGGCDFVKSLYDHTKATIEELDQPVRESPVAQYEVMKLFAEHGEPNTPRTVLFEMAARMGSKSALDPRKLFERLCEGEFDPKIAKDILTYTPAPDEKLNPLYEKIQAMQRLVEGVCPELESDEIQTRLAEHIETWPEESVIALVKIRDGLIRQLDAKLATYTRNRNANTDTSSSTTIEEAVQEYFKIIYPGPKVFMGTKQSKRRGRGQQRGRVTSEQIISPSEQEGFQPRALAYINAAGEVFGPDTDKFQELKQNYLKKFPGAKGLEDDIDAMTTYLSTLRMDQGRQNGVKQYGDTVKRGGEDLALYALKPGDAPGLPMSSRRGRDTRVLFSFGKNDEILLHGLVPRERVPEFEKRLQSSSNGNINR